MVEMMEMMLVKIEGGRRRGRQRMRWLDGITDVTDMSLHKLRGEGDGQGGPVCCSLWDRKGDTTEQQQYLLHPKLLMCPPLFPFGNHSLLSVSSESLGYNIIYRGNDLADDGRQGILPQKMPYSFGFQFSSTV